jgi:hypothetical protein
VAVTKEVRLRPRAALKRTRREASKATVLRGRLAASDLGRHQLAARRLVRAALAARRPALVHVLTTPPTRSLFICSNGRT